MGNCLGTIGDYRDTIGHSVTQCYFIIFTSKIAIWSLLLLAVSELILLPASHAASSQCFALERGGAAALSVSLIPFGRLSILLLAVVAPWGATPELAVLAHF